MHTTTKWFLTACFCWSLWGCASNPDQLHQSLDVSLPANIGLQGYSPISYFEHDRAVRGNPNYSFEYQKRIYYFTDAEQIETFKRNPEKYMPKYGEYCPYSLALGRRVAIDPTNFKMQDGQLLLFHDSVELISVDVPAQSLIFEEADRQFELLKF